MASFTHELGAAQCGRAGARPSFSSHKTSDRLRECEQLSPTSSKLKPSRRSVFKEEGLDEIDTAVHHSHSETNSPGTPLETESIKSRKTTFGEILGTSDEGESSERKDNSAWYSKLVKAPRPTIKSSATAPPSSFSSMPRVALLAFLIAVVWPGFRYNSGGETVSLSGADAGVIREAALVSNGNTIEGRADSPTDVCTRWAHQVANVNGTLYIYGGNAKSSSSQTDNFWNNDFLSLDLTNSWGTGSPPLTGLTQPSGPPAVALGALWNSYTSLWVYGGEFSSDPETTPAAVSTWQYDISSSTWTEQSNLQTAAGNYSDGGNQSVQRAAEGAGISIPELGLSYYFGGHQDAYTTPGWSVQVARIYLKSLLEFTHPGYANTGVSSLGSTASAGSEGVYRNITQGGLQAESGFTERADGVLVYIPGWGTEGIILGLAGGTNETFTEMNVIDIYDVANSTWYKQSTSGPSPPIRVNPCAVVAAAPDGSSFNVYLYGGQNLIPAGNQTQYSDMWILTIPSFTWVQVNMDGQSQPPARAGHTCTLSSGQMVVVGGYVGTEISCDSPGIYVFNASSLQWSTSYTPIASSSSSGSSGSNDNTQGSSVLEDSVGYQVPGLVQSIIGGSSAGGATATQPAAGSATAGPIATGKPPSFTVTASGSIVTQTSPPSSSNTGSGQTTSSSSGPNIGAIVAGVVAAALAILAGYLAFCTWLYRRQLALYKNHVAMAQRTAFNNSPDTRSSEKAGGAVLGPFGTDISGGSGSAGRPSNVESGNSGLPVPSPYSGITGAGSSSVPTPEYGGGKQGYGRSSEDGEDSDTEYHGAGDPLSRHSIASSSMLDLIGGQEPSFFNVVLNPRRILRVVNSD